MSTTETKPRWYVVTDKKDGAECLVEANNRAQAYRRCAEFYCNATPAGVTDTIRILQNGGDVIHGSSGPEQLDLEEVAGDAPAPEVKTGELQPPAMKKAGEVFAAMPNTEPEAK